MDLTGSTPPLSSPRTPIGDLERRAARHILSARADARRLARDAGALAALAAAHPADASLARRAQEAAELASQTAVAVEQGEAAVGALLMLIEAGGHLADEAAARLRHLLDASVATRAAHARRRGPAVQRARRGIGRHLGGAEQARTARAETTPLCASRCARRPGQRRRRARRATRAPSSSDGDSPPPSAASGPRRRLPDPSLSSLIAAASARGAL